MSSILDWQQGTPPSTLVLSGVLDRDSLLPFWHGRQRILTADIQALDVSRLERVDSAGLAMLIHLLDEADKRGQAIKLNGVTDRLKTLITLYNLQAIVEPYAE